ncbi:MAG: type IV toxin-antitoxin system AbiEi family antitoxin [Gemmatimonadota bacterium]
MRHQTTMTTRSIPASLASVLEELELERPAIVTKETLGRLIERAGLEQDPGQVASRLQSQGWLLTLRTRGAWEFAPASRAGPIGSGDPFIELKATLSRRPGLPVAVAYDSAAWLHRLSQRVPTRHVLAIPSGENVPHALRMYRVTRQWGRLDFIEIQSLPVWRMETLITLIGAQPQSFRDWPNIGKWLSEACDRLEPRLLLSELERRPRSTWMRTGYILEAGGGIAIADHLRTLAPPGRGPFYLGSRDGSGRYDKKWEVMDSLLRFRRTREVKVNSGQRQRRTGEI